MCDEPSNAKRAQWALNALMSFATETGLVGDTNTEELCTVIADFLVDLRHLCHQQQLPIQDLIEASADTFQLELQTETEDG